MSITVVPRVPSQNWESYSAKSAVYTNPKTQKADDLGGTAIFSRDDKGALYLFHTQDFFSFK